MQEGTHELPRHLYDGVPNSQGLQAAQGKAAACSPYT